MGAISTVKGRSVSDTVGVTTTGLCSSLSASEGPRSNIWSCTHESSTGFFLLTSGGHAMVGARAWVSERSWWSSLLSWWRLLLIRGYLNILPCNTWEEWLALLDSLTLRVNWLGNHALLNVTHSNIVGWRFVVSLDSLVHCEGLLGTLDLKLRRLGSRWTIFQPCYVTF